MVRVAVIMNTVKLDTRSTTLWLSLPLRKPVSGRLACRKASLVLDATGLPDFFDVFAGPESQRGAGWGASLAPLAEGAPKPSWAASPAVSAIV